MCVHTLALEVTDMSVTEMSLPHADPRCGHLGARADTFSLQRCVSLCKHVLGAVLLLELVLYLCFLCDKM